jgi:hypothetical protein
LSHAKLERALFGGANLLYVNLHNVADTGARFEGALTTMLRRTDFDRLEAEAYRPPQP